jgi:hypothetical protein
MTPCDRQSADGSAAWRPAMQQHVRAQTHLRRRAAGAVEVAIRLRVRPRDVPAAAVAGPAEPAPEARAREQARLGERVVHVQPPVPLGNAVGALDAPRGREAVERKRRRAGAAGGQRALLELVQRADRARRPQQARERRGRERGGGASQRGGQAAPGRLPSAAAARAGRERRSCAPRPRRAAGVRGGPADGPLHSSSAFMPRLAPISSSDRQITIRV